MSSSNARKLTVSLPPEVVTQLDFAAGRLRCSRSALLGQILTRTLPGMFEVCLGLPDVDVDTGVSPSRRLRGRSALALSHEFDIVLGGILYATRDK